jgi:hypothetical protein
VLIYKTLVKDNVYGAARKGELRQADSCTKLNKTSQITPPNG